MRDEVMQTLVRMAVEAEQLDANAVVAARTPTRHFQRLIFVASAIAACLALLAALTAPMRPSRSTAPTRPVASAPGARVFDPITISLPELAPTEPIITLANSHPDAAAAPIHDSRRSMLLCLFRGSDDRCGCTVWREVTWDSNRRLSQVGRGELLGAALRSKCSPSSNLVLIVALEGPAEDLPVSHSAAEALAECVTSGAGGCGDDGPCFATSALRCLPESVTVVAETLTLASK